MTSCVGLKFNSLKKTLYPLATTIAAFSFKFGATSVLKTRG